jgi:hypothetical protein
MRGQNDVSLRQSFAELEGGEKLREVTVKFSLLWLSLSFFTNLVHILIIFVIVHLSERKLLNRKKNKGKVTTEIRV